MNQNKWSIFRILMVIVTVLFVIARISNIIYLLELSNMPIIGNLIFPFLIQLSFLVILIFIPNQYRFLAILPIIYFIGANLVEFQNFMRYANEAGFDAKFVFQITTSKVIALSAYTTYLILLLPNFEYKTKHAILAGFFIILSVILFFINLFINMGYFFNHNSLSFILTNLFNNFMINIGIYIIFTLYIIEHIKNKQITEL